MTYNDPARNEPAYDGRIAHTARGKGWGVTGLLIVALVLVLALIMTFAGPTDTRQASDAIAPQSSTESSTPGVTDIPQPAQ